MQKMLDKHEMLYNGSGYCDITAYLAMKGFEMDGLNYNDGDIVTVEQNNGEECEMLILKCHTHYATATMLKDSLPSENAIPVISRKKMYIDGGRTGYVFYDRISGFVKELPADSLDEIRKQIASAMGLCIEEIKGKIDAETEKREEHELPAITKMQIKKLTEDLIEAKTELRIFRELYEKERNRGNKADERGYTE